MRTRTSLSTSALVISVLVVSGLGGTTRAADVYQMDPAHSAVIFRIKHMGVGYTYGRFNDVSGSVTVDEQNPAGTALTVELKTESIDTANEKRDQHLKGPDFFNAKEFPTITFKSKAVKLVKDHTYEVTGELSLHGVTRSLTVQLERIGSAQDPRGNYRTGFEANFAIKRSDFGMGFMPGGIGDEVWLLVGFEAIRQ